MSVQAAKGVEVGLGFETARRRGSPVHDEIYFDEASRRSCAAPTTPAGPRAACRAASRSSSAYAFKPLSTLMSPLHSVDIETEDRGQGRDRALGRGGHPGGGGDRRGAWSPSWSRDAFLEKFGGDSLVEIRRNLDGYLEQVRSF